MADWYVSSTAYAAVPQWTASTAYTIGQFVRALAAPGNNTYVYRCTTAGTTAASEPSWSGGNNATTTSGTATFTNVTGQSVYGWSAAAGMLYSISNGVNCRPVVGDRVFLSSDHSETTAGVSYHFNNYVTAIGDIFFISVNRAGSVPPVLADLQPGAQIISSSANISFESFTCMWLQGITFRNNGTGGMLFNNSTVKTYYLKDCAIISAATGSVNMISSGNPVKIILDNTTLQFGAVGQRIINGYNMEFVWINTPSAIQGGIIPTTLFIQATLIPLLVTCRGVDFSALTTTLCSGNSATGGLKVLLDSCKVASGLTRYGLPAATNAYWDEVELINCHDGTSLLTERHSSSGDLTIERSTVMTAGAIDSLGAYSLKLVSGVRSDKHVLPLDSFWFDIENTVIGSARTATVEIISSGSLNNDDIKLAVQYMGTSGLPTTSRVDSLPSMVTAVAALPTSSVSWSSPPSTPVKQYVSVTFTPMRVGRVRGRISLGKISTTVWVNPQIALT